MNSRNMESHLKERATKCSSTMLKSCIKTSLLVLVESKLRVRILILLCRQGQCPIHISYQILNPLHAHTNSHQSPINSSIAHSPPLTKLSAPPKLVACLNNFVFEQNILACCSVPKYIEKHG